MWKNSRKSLVFFFQRCNKCLISECFPRGQISFNLALIGPQNEKCHNSLMSALRRGYRMFAVHHEKRLVLAFLKVFVNLESGKIKSCKVLF